MQAHYTRIASEFDSLWQFSADYEPWMLQQIVAQANLTSSDRLSDFGAGTGRFTQALVDRCNLTQAWAIDPDIDMCHLATTREGLTVVQANEHSLFDHDLHYDCLLMKEVIHHLSDRRAFWRRVLGQLSDQGRVLIVTRPQQTQLALFDAAKAAFADHQPSVSSLVRELDDAGYRTEVSVKSLSFSMPKTRWFAMLRARFMSDLSVFSDDTIELGIAQLDQLHTGENITMQDNILFILAKKV